jgi:hypothetical protein
MEARGMADIDIDKMLEKHEKKEKDAKAKKRIYTAVIAGGSAAAAALIAIIIILLLKGETASAYFPLDPGKKLVYNIKGKNPQEWQIQGKTENVYGYECSVMDKMDKGTYLTVREYYAEDEKKGIAKLAYSENGGPLVKDVFVIMPYTVKTGMSFRAAMYMGEVVTGEIVSKEKMSTPAGELETYKVTYKSPHMDRAVWYAKGVGIVKMTDNLTAEETGLISAGE